MISEIPPRYIKSTIMFQIRGQWEQQLKNIDEAKSRVFKYLPHSANLIANVFYRKTIKRYANINRRLIVLAVNSLKLQE